MDRLLQDALDIQRLVPWIESDEDIINFMRKIPLDKSYLRKPLTLRYFLKQKDSDNDFDQTLEDDAREIVVAFPDMPYKTIIDHLKNFEGMMERKEIVLRLLLSKRQDLDDLLYQLENSAQAKGVIEQQLHNYNYVEQNINELERNVDNIVSQFNNSVNRKRNTEVSNPTNSETNIKIKIRRVDGSLEVQSSIKQDSSTKVQVTAPSKNLYPLNVRQVTDTVITSSKKSELASLDMDQPTTSTMNKNQIEADSSSDKSATVTFNLIEYLKEVTHAETEYIEQVCKEINIRIDQRPHSAVLDSLLNRIIGEDISNPVPVKSVNKEFPEEITYNSEDSNLSSVLDGAEELESSSDDTEIVDNSIIEIPNNSFSNSIIMLDNQSTPIITTKVPVSNSNFASVPCSSKSEETNESKTKETIVDQKLVLRLREMFPQASPGYISEICKDRVWDQFDEIVEIILSNPEHPKRPEKQPSPPPEIDPEDQYEIVKALLPDADPTYLRMQCEAMEYDPTKLTEFVNRANELKTYPTMKEYLRKQKFTAQSKQYTTDFQVAKFVELFPDPEKTFNDPNRTIKLDVYKEQYIYQYFGNKFDKIQKKVIWTTLLENKFNVITTNKKLNSYLKKNQEKTMKCRRKHVNSIEHVQDILLLQELAYLDHKKEIEKFIEERKKKDEEDFNYAKDNQLLNACQCCYDEEVMPKNTFYCPEGHKFCKDCMTKSCEVALGDGKTDFKCMIECDEEFTLSTLQLALPPKMFSKLAQKKQLAEVKAAGLQELEFCPFCDFASIPDESDKIFRCLNPECMKESCRKCKEPNHIPLSCEEVEKDEEVKTRTYIENKMTEALLRKCWKCEKSFFKEEGCNEMTSTCGAIMCYVCQKSV